MRKLCVKLYANLLNAKENFLRDETGAVDIVAVVLLVGVAVSLAVLFKSQITTVLSRILGDVVDKTDNWMGSSSGN